MQWRRGEPVLESIIQVQWRRASTGVILPQGSVVESALPGTNSIQVKQVILNVHMVVHIYWLKGFLKQRQISLDLFLSHLKGHFIFSEFGTMTETL